VHRVRADGRDTASEGGGDLQIHAGVASRAGEQVRDRRPVPGGRNGPASQGGTAAEGVPRVRDAVRQDPADGGAQQVPPPGHGGWQQPKMSPAISWVMFVRIKVTAMATDSYRPITAGLPPA